MKAKKKSIIRQCVERLFGMRAFGQSKHADKIRNNGKPARGKIYSGRTLSNYIAACCRFVKWVCREYGRMDLEEARQYVGVYLRMRIKQEKSAWTIRAEAAALAKLYQCSMGDFGVRLPKRYRRDVKQHRGKCWEGHYDTQKHYLLEMFCKACGLRRHEVAQLCTQNVYRDKNGRVIVHVRQGKGGKERFVAALNDTPLVLAQQAAADGRKYIFPHIPKYAPVHEWRAVYARELYKKLERPLDEILQKERYICRKERAGIIYDKCAMQIVSHMLGHARLDVVTSYL